MPVQLVGFGYILLSQQSRSTNLKWFHVRWSHVRQSKLKPFRVAFSKRLQLRDLVTWNSKKICKITHVLDEVKDQLLIPPDYYIHLNNPLTSSSQTGDCMSRWTNNSDDDDSIFKTSLSFLPVWDGLSTPTPSLSTAKPLFTVESYQKILIAAAQQKKVEGSHTRTQTNTTVVIYCNLKMKMYLLKWRSRVITKKKKELRLPLLRHFLPFAIVKQQRATTSKSL